MYVLSMISKVLLNFTDARATAGSRYILFATLLSITYACNGLEKTKYYRRDATYRAGAKEARTYLVVTC